ncbi:MAG: glycosyltransferase [Planctomycetia bacterium]|nr:glycosyltransferase [Planctomycetia bacterium]
MTRSAPPPSTSRAFPLRLMFIHTVMPVGGAETLLINLIRRLDRRRFTPEVCCLKYPGPLGEVLAKEAPLFSGLLAGKYDLRVLPRLVRLLCQRRIDAVVTVGAGDRMFWGRLAAKIACVPVVLTALHSTGWPDVVGRLNRLLTPITDGFIAVAEEHGRYLREVERFPAQKVFVIQNGVDVERFRPQPKDEKLRRALGLAPEMLVVGIVAALRPEKDHALFLRVARRVQDMLPEARFLVVGDGVLRGELEALAGRLGLAESVLFLGNRSDVPELLALMDVVVLTSKMEANPVTILEAMAAGKPFVAPAVGSVSESIQDGQTGYLARPGDEHDLADKIDCVLRDPALAKAMGRLARNWVVEHGSLETMVAGYELLLARLYERKTGRRLELPAEAPSDAAALLQH